MRLDFATLLTALAALTGLIWLADSLLFARRRSELAGGAEVAEPVLVEYARSFFPVIFIVLLLRSFLAEPFRIPSSSMMPTLLIGDFILVNKFSYGLKLPVVDYEFLDFGSPERGDVIVFRYPVDPHEDYIKRVVGLPGDQILYQKKRLYVNGKEVSSEYLTRYVGIGSGRDMSGAELKQEQLGEVSHQILQRPEIFRGDGEGRWTVPEGSYFVMGDNRDNSLDSRYWGFVPEGHVVGKAVAVWMNWDSANGGVDFGRVGTVIH